MGGGVVYTYSVSYLYKKGVLLMYSTTMLNVARRIRDLGLDISKTNPSRGLKAILAIRQPKQEKEK